MVSRRIVWYIGAQSFGEIFCVRLQGTVSVRLCHHHYQWGLLPLYNQE